MECFINHFRCNLAVKVLFNGDHKTDPTMRKKIPYNVQVGGISHW